MDLEEYKEKTGGFGERGTIKLKGLKEGLLYRQNSPNYFNSHDEEYFYGFENNYGASVKRIIGYGETDGARECPVSCTHLDVYKRQDHRREPDKQPFKRVKSCSGDSGFRIAVIPA